MNVILSLVIFTSLISIVNFLLIVKIAYNNNKMKENLINKNKELEESTSNDKKLIPSRLQRRIQTFAINSLHVFKLDNLSFDSEEELNERLIDEICKKLSELDDYEITKHLANLDNDQLERLILTCLDYNVIKDSKQRLINISPEEFRNEDKPPKINNNYNQVKDITNELNKIINME